MSLLLFWVCILVLASLAWTEEPPGGYYTTRYDHLDIENILNQKRLVYYYTECLLDRGPCTPQGVEFKRILPEAIRTGCMRCTEKQRFVTLKSIRRLKKEYPEIWSQLGAVWDPTGEYVQRLEEAAEQKSSKTASTAKAPPLTQPVLAASATSNSATTVIPRVASAAKISTTSSPRPTSAPTSTTSSPSTTTRRRTTESPSTTTRRRTTESRIIYNYDFAIPPDPLPENRKPIPAFTNVIRSVNNIIAPITDIAGKVINAGTDIAGIVLDALGVRKV